VNIRLHSTQEECEEAVTLLSSIMVIHSLSGPYRTACAVCWSAFTSRLSPRGGR
jgi:hypothetical protein